MATHSSTLAWQIPRMEEPGGLPSLGSHRVGHDWSDLAAAAADRIKYHRLGSSKRSFFACTSGGWKSKIKVLAGFVFPRPLLAYRGLSSPCLHIVFPLYKSVFKFHLKGHQPCWIRAYVSDLTHLLLWRLYLQMHFEALGVRTSISEFVEGDTILPLTQDKLLFSLCYF